MKQLELTANGITVKIAIRNATNGDYMRKSLLAAQAMKDPLEDAADQTVAMVIYPRCLACVVEGSIIRKNADGLDEPAQSVRDLTPKEFVDLPGEIGEAWLTAALEENPGWSLTPPDPAQLASAEKKG